MRFFRLIPGLLVLALSGAHAEDTPFSIARDTIANRNAALAGGGGQTPLSGGAPIGGERGGDPLPTGRYNAGLPMGAGRADADGFRAGVPAVPMGQVRGNIDAGGNIQYRQNFSMDGVARRPDAATPERSEVAVEGGMVNITLSPEAARSFENRIAPGGLTVGVTLPTRYAGNPSAPAALQSTFVRIRPENVERVGDGLVIRVAAPPGVSEGANISKVRFTGGSDGPTRSDPDRAIQPTALTIRNEVASAPPPPDRPATRTPSPNRPLTPLPPPETSIGYNASMTAANPVTLTPPTAAVPAAPGVAARAAFQPVVAFVPAANAGAVPAAGTNIPMMATVRSPTGVVTMIPVTGALHPTNDFAAPGTAAVSFNLPRGATLISARTVPPAAAAPPLPAGFQHFSMDFNHQPALNTIAITAMHTPPEP